MKRKGLFIIIIVLAIALVFGGGVYAGMEFSAKDVSFSPVDSSWNVNNVSDALSDLKNEQIEFDDFELLWAPTARECANGTIDYSGTYKFTQNYRYVMVTLYTSYWASTTISANNMNLIKNYDFGDCYMGERVSFYKDVDATASFTFGFSSMTQTGVRIYGIK